MIILKSKEYILFEKAFDSFKTAAQKKQAFYIIETAIDCYSKRGIGNSALSTIANRASCSLSKLKFYFNNSETLILSTLKYIRLLYQEYVVSEISKATNPQQRFDLYFTACLDWPQKNKQYAAVWISAMHKASKDKSVIDLNTIAVQTGLERLATLIQEGKDEKVFFCDSSKSAAQTIHTLMTGFLLSIFTEKQSDRLNKEKILKTQCLKILKSID